jgi:class 3 adenylate cyclase/pimeloyl-ACP methyl ester carboxylesterase
MQQPPIQYCKTADGVGIAFWTLGEGPPLVILPIVLAGHVQLEWEFDIFRATYERLAAATTVIRFDLRGLGLSQRHCLDLSTEAGMLDLEAVTDHLGLHRFALFGGRPAAGELLFAYPVRHPERVSHLIISAPPMRPSFAQQLAAIAPVIEKDWELFTEIWARVALGWEAQQAANLARRVRAAHTPESFKLALEAMAFSPDNHLPEIRVATLIVHGTASEDATGTARALAAGIAGAQLVGIPNWPVASNFNESMVEAMTRFVNTRTATPGAPVPAPSIDISAVRTIVFTDVEGSTALNERLGDEGARKVMREHERLTREVLEAHGGAEVKTMGDGFMAWFPSATRAVDCAIALQRAMDERNRGVGSSHPRRERESAQSDDIVEQDSVPISVDDSTLRVRVGINAGEPLVEGDDLFGASVIAAARISAAAEGGQILASDVVRQLLAGKGFVFEERGEHALKGFDEPVRLYEVDWQAEH